MRDRIKVRELLVRRVNMGILDPRLRKACDVVLTDERFWEAPASATDSKNNHHCWNGGLAEHTFEVLQNAVAMVDAKSDLDIVVAAALFHDYMKVRSYDRHEYVVKDQNFLSPGWVGNDYKKKIYHIAGSYAEWVKIAEEALVEQETIDAVGHCILAHHGRPEWGSPVVPQTREAYILHSADMLSANFNKT